MAKEAYKIPADMDQTYLDMELAIQGKDGIGLKPLPIKTILSWIASILLCFWICTKTVIANGGLWIILFVIFWGSLTYFLLSTDKTKRMQIQDIAAAVNYIPKMSRRLLTRSTSNAAEFYRLLGIDSINDETGLIAFNDGTFGFVMSVVGSASILLFDEDRTAILNRVDNFYRKMNTDYQVIYITSKEAQRVYHQIANLQKRFNTLNNNDPDLRACAEEQYSMLKDVVGKEYKSIHQYMIIKAENREVLQAARNVIRSEAENSTLMFKKLTWLYNKDEKELMRLIVSGREEE